MKKMSMSLLFIFLLGLSACFSQTPKDLKITFNGLKNVSIIVGSDPIDLLKGITATDQSGKKYKITVIQSIDYNKIDTYIVTYQVIVNETLFEDYIDVVIKHDKTSHDAVKKELTQKLVAFETSLTMSPFFIKETLFEASFTNNKAEISIVNLTKSYPDQLIHETTYVYSTPPQTDNSITLLLPSGIYRFNMIDHMLFRPTKVETIKVDPVLDKLLSLPGAYIIKDNDIYVLETTFQTIKDHASESHFLTQLSNHYGYELNQTSAKVFMTISITDKLLIDVKIVLHNIDYVFFITYEFENENSPKIKVDELSQKASTDFNDVLLGLAQGKTHEMSFDNRTESRYFKINVSKDAHYRVNFDNREDSYKYYDENHNPVSIEFKKIVTQDSIYHYFTSPVEGDLYVALERHQRYISSGSEIISFFYEQVNQLPKIEDVSLILDDTITYESTGLDSLNGVNLILTMTPNTYYKIMMTPTITAYDFSSTMYSTTTVNGIDYINAQDGHLTISLYDNTTVTLIKENPFK